MYTILQSIGWWGIDFHLSALLLLLVAVAALSRVRQPARRLAQLKQRVKLLLDHDFVVEPACSRRRRATIAGLMIVLTVSLSLPSLRRAASAADAGSPNEQNALSFTGLVRAHEMPVAGAKVYLRESPVGWSHSEAGWRPSATRDIAQAVTVADGSFEFKDVKLPAPKPGRDYAFPLDVIAIAPGHGVAWRHLAARPTAPVELALPAERKVAGQLVGRDGKPIHGARVRVREIAGLADPWRPMSRLPSYLDLDSCGAPPAALSDADGQFVLRGVPDGVRATLVVDDERFVPRETCAASTDNPQDDLVEWLENDESRSVPVHSWYCKIEVERAYRLRGKVVFDDTGEPAVGAGFNHPPILHTADGVVDADGRFALNHLAPGTVRLRISPPAGSSYLGFKTAFALPGDNYDVELAARLRRGELVRGEVIDAVSGKGIGGASISYFEKFPPTLNGDAFVPMVRSAADGRFTMAVPSGMAMLVIAGPVPGYVTYQQLSAAPPEFHQTIDAQPGQPHAEVLFKLQPKPNAALIGKVVDADWKSVADAEIHYQGFGKKSGSGITLPPSRTTSDSRGAFALNDLDPSLEYGVRVLDRRRGRGAFVLVSGLQAKQPALIVRLRPLATVAGRVVDEQSRPVAAVLWLRHLQGGYGHVDREPVATDAEGRFEFAGLMPGVPYSLEARAEGYAEKNVEAFTLTVGENHTLGDIVPPKADQELSGMLVDADGKPVAGALVRASAASDPSSFRVNTDVCVTDRAGRFRLRGLPNGGALVWQTFSVIGDRKTLLGQAAAGSSNLRFVAKPPNGGPARKRD